MKKEKLNIVVFRNNLRVHDNAPLFYASKEEVKTLAIYSFEIVNKKNVFQSNFIYESLYNLKDNLKKLNLNLIFTDSFRNILEKLNKEFDLKIFFDHEVGVTEKKIEELFEEYRFEKSFNQTMISPFNFDYTKSFSHFRKKAEKIDVPKPLGKPDSFKETLDYELLELPNSQIDLIFKGGEDEALKRVDYYMNFIHEYKDTRDKVDVANASNDSTTKFSSYLSVGCVSPRYIYAKIKEEESHTYESKSSYWIYFELLWRDFFHLVMNQSGNKLFLKGGLKEIEYNYKSPNYMYDKFFAANCGVDIIDASIKELTTTGFMSNRNRQLVASFFIKNLGFNWLDCAKLFEDNLIDYNPASNYGNFAYQAYVGNDSTYRVFDIVKQSKLYGGKNYVKKWLSKDESYEGLNLRSMSEDVENNVYNK